MKRFALACIALLLTVGLAMTAYGEEALPPPKWLTTKHMLADFKYAYDALTDDYPYFEELEREYNFDWQAHHDHYQQLVMQAKTVEQFEQVMKLMLQDLRDGQARLLTSGEYYAYYNDMLDTHSDKEELDKIAAKRRYAYSPSTHMELAATASIEADANMIHTERNTHLHTLPNSGFVLQFPSEANIQLAAR